MAEEEMAFQNATGFGDNDVGIDVEQIHADSFDSFMEEVQENVYDIIRRSSTAPTNALDAWRAFYHAVDWTENWIRGILAFHVIILTLVILLRNNANAQCAIFAVIFILTRAAETMNSYAAEHWKEFSTQNYFDKNGVFTGTVFAAPLLCIAFLQLINFLYITSKTLIVAKRLQIQRTKELKAKRELKEKEQEQEQLKSQEVVGAQDQQDGPEASANQQEQQEEQKHQNNNKTGPSRRKK